MKKYKVKNQDAFLLIKKIKAQVVTIVCLMILTTLTSCDTGDDGGDEGPFSEEELLQQQLETITQMAQKFKDFQVAIDEGYAEPLPFNPSPYVPNMGHHYINVQLIDGEFDMEKPEILLYVPQEDGTLELVGIEYAIPLALSADPPEGFAGDSDVWENNPNVAEGSWTLHAWVILENPDGVFAPFNPNVPAESPASN